MLKTFIVESCDSKECKIQYKKDIIKGLIILPVTCKEMDKENEIITSLSCGKTRKF